MGLTKPSPAAIRALLLLGAGASGPADARKYYYQWDPTKVDGKTATRRLSWTERSSTRSGSPTTNSYVA